jgi:hypothetical protein
VQLHAITLTQGDSIIVENRDSRVSEPGLWLELTVQGKQKKYKIGPGRDQPQWWESEDRIQSDFDTWLLKSVLVSGGSLSLDDLSLNGLKAEARTIRSRLPQKIQLYVETLEGQLMTQIKLGMACENSKRSQDSGTTPSTR